MKRTNKKGFTIVELVIVIAVIAILAAILIPTFVRLIRKSKINTDTQLIRNLNTALEADKVDNTHSTMSDALEAAAKYGYDVSKINASATNNEILWDSENDVFCYFNDGEIEYLPDSVDNNRKLSAESNKLWKIYNGSVPSVENQTYSIYLGNATAANSINNGKVKVGLDVGNQSIDAITYEHSGSAQDVVIRTNSASTTLNIKAPADTIKHYGAVGSLNIEAVANASYHEFGKVAFAEIKTGRIVLESESEVEHLHLTATEGNFVDITVAKANDVEMPEFSRDPVDLSSGSKLIVALQDGTKTTDAKDYVWLTEVGIYEQITLGTADAAGTNYAAASSSQEKKDAAQQIANNITFSEGGQDYKVTATKVNDEWTYEVKTEAGQATTYTATVDAGVVIVEDSSNNTVDTTTENGLNADEKQAAKTEVVNEAIESVEYAGVAVTKAGEATQLMTLEAFRDSVNAGTDYAEYTVKLLNTIDLNGIEWTPIGTTEHPFSGVFDGQNYTIKNYKIRGEGKNKGLALFGCIKGTASTLTSATNLSDFYSATNYSVNLPDEEIFTCVVKNLNVSGADVNTTADGWSAAVVAYVEDATISNIRLSGSVITVKEKVGGIVGFLPSDYACYITNCTTLSDVTVTASTGNHSAGILGRVDTDKSRGIIANCTNNATINCAGVNGGGIAGQAKNVLYYNNTNNGSVTGNKRAAGIATDCTGSVIFNCTNNGYIKTTAVYSGGSDSSAGIASYLASNGNSVIVNCHNSGTIEGNAPKDDTRIAGIAGGGVDKNDKIINNSNTGTLINNAEGGKVYDICNLSSVANEVTPSDLSGLNEETAKANKYIKVNSSLVLSENDNTVTFNGQEKLEFVNSPKYLTLDLTGANKSSFVLMVNDTVVTLKNGGDNYVTIFGKGNTVKVDENETVKYLTVLNDDTQSASSFNILGNATNLVLKGNGLVNGEIAENATAERVVFSGNGTFTLTNRGTISHTTSGIYGNEHTIDTITASNITIYNYGTIEAKKNESDVASYALLFFGGATVKLYAYNGSNIIAEGNKSVIVTNGGTQVNVYYQDGAEVTYYGSQNTYPKAFGYYCTVTKMN